MDHDEFLNKLNQFAELRAIRPARNAGAREAQEDAVIERHGKTIVLDYKNNQTWAYEVKKLKKQVRICDYCGDPAKNQVITKRYLTYPEPHWREKCNACDLTKNPETGKFEIKKHQEQAFFVSYFLHRNK